MIDIESLDSKVKLVIERNNLWSSGTIVLKTGHEITYNAKYISSKEADTYSSSKPGFILTRMEVFNGVSLYKFNDKFFDSIDECQKAASANFEERLRKIFFGKDEIEYIDKLLSNQKVLEGVAEKVKLSTINRTFEYSTVVRDMKKLLRIATYKQHPMIKIFKRDLAPKLKERIFLALMSLYQREENITVKNSISEVITSLDLY